MSSFPIDLEQIDRMTTLQKRIEEILTAMRWGSTELAKAAGVSVGAVSQWKSGATKSLRGEVASRIQAATGYSALWITTGKTPKKAAESNALQAAKQHPIPSGLNLTYAGSPQKSKGIPVVGTARMGEDGYYTELEYPVGHGDGHVEGYSSDASAYALRVRGDSMAPAIKDGYFVIVEPHGACVPGEYVVIAMKSGEKLCKELMFERTDTIAVQSVNGGAVRTIERKDIEHMHPVSNIISPSKWRPE
jgi:phage repressor protein C with HTH and peptisase S24 domain